MTVSGRLESPPPQAEELSSPTGGPSGRPELTIQVASYNAAISTQAVHAYDATTGSLRRLSVAYALGGLTYAIVMSLPWMINAGGGFFPLARLLWLVVCYAWPIVLALMLIVPSALPTTLMIGASYFALVVFAGMIVLVHSPDLESGHLVFFWCFANFSSTA